MRPTSQGGLACPDLFQFFLATQLVTAACWLNPDITNPTSLVKVAVLKWLEALKFLLFQGPIFIDTLNAHYTARVGGLVSKLNDTLNMQSLPVPPDS